jgi:N-acetylmuramoyl-L-alanine amidase
MQWALFGLMAAWLSGCAIGPPIDYSYTAKNQDSRAQFLILHYTAGNFAGSLKTLTEGPVSSHYLVSEGNVNLGIEPVIYQLVDENRRAFHAGVSHWKGQTFLNASSIGIEIVNLGYRDGPQGREWFDYPKAQMDLVLELCKDIVRRHNIRPDRVLAHSDIAPGRKSDPGPRFPWRRFAEAGLIPWPDAQLVAQLVPAYERQLPQVAWFQQKLVSFGYGLTLGGEKAELDTPTRNAIAALQMRYRQARFDGVPDAETAAILDALTRPPPAPSREAVGVNPDAEHHHSHHEHSHAHPH